MEENKLQICILGSDLEKLHSIINPAYLPVELGGKVVPESFEDYSKRLGKFDDIFRGLCIKYLIFST